MEKDYQKVGNQHIYWVIWKNRSLTMPLATFSNEVLDELDQLPVSPTAQFLSADWINQGSPKISDVYNYGVVRLRERSYNCTCSGCVAYLDRKTMYITIGNIREELRCPKPNDNT